MEIYLPMIYFLRRWRPIFLKSPFLVTISQPPLVRKLIKTGDLDTIVPILHFFFVKHTCLAELDDPSYARSQHLNRITIVGWSDGCGTKIANRQFGKHSGLKFDINLEKHEYIWDAHSEEVIRIWSCMRMSLEAIVMVRRAEARSNLLITGNFAPLLLP